VPTESPVLRKSLRKSFHKRGPATPNDRSPNVLLKRGTCKSAANTTRFEELKTNMIVKTEDNAANHDGSNLAILCSYDAFWRTIIWLV